MKRILFILSFFVTVAAFSQPVVGSDTKIHHSNSDLTIINSNEINLTGDTTTHKAGIVFVGRNLFIGNGFYYTDATSLKVNLSDTLAMLDGRINSITINNSGILHTTPLTFTRVGGAWSATQTLATQSAYTALARGSGSGTPSFQSLDTLWIPNFAAKTRSLFVAGNGLSYLNGTFTADTSILSTKNNVTAKLIGYASDALVAHLAGTETFTGTKTFNNLVTVPTIYLTTTDPGILTYSTTAPTDAKNWVVVFDHYGYFRIQGRNDALSSTTDYFQMIRSGALLSQAKFMNLGSQGGTISFAGAGSSGTAINFPNNGTNYSYIQNTGSSNEYIAFGTTQVFSFAYNGTNTHSLLSNGLVLGAATSSANAMLDVRGGGIITGSLGIGSSPAGNLYISKSITGGITSYGFSQVSVVQSDVTSEASYNRTLAQTQAAAFTLGTLYHNRAEQGTFGIGSTVTTQIAFAASTSLSGAGTNLGFVSSIGSTSSTNRNLSISGSAPNYIAAALMIGNNTNNGADILQVTGTSLFTGKTVIAGSVSSSSGFGYNVGITGTTVATSSTDIIAGLYVVPAFTRNGSTSQQYAIYADGSGFSNGNAAAMFKSSVSGNGRTIATQPTVSIQHTFSGFSGGGGWTDKILDITALNVSQSSGENIIGLSVNISAVTYTNKYAALFNGGSVGIGTATPAYLLDVNGTTNFTGASNHGSTVGIAGITTISSTASVTTNYGTSALNVAGSAFFGTGNGNQGTVIKAAVGQAGYQAIILDQPSGIIQIYAGNADGSGGFQRIFNSGETRFFSNLNGSSAGGFSTFYLAGSEKMRLAASTGALLINTTSDNGVDKLQLLGTQSINASSANTALGITQNYAATGVQISHSTNAFAALVITKTGYNTAQIINNTTGSLVFNANAAGLEITGNYQHSGSAGIGQGIIVTATNNTGVGLLHGIKITATANTSGATAYGIYTSALSTSGTAYAIYSAAGLNFFAGASSFSSTITASSLIKSGGTSAQILAADGSVLTAGTNITISGGTISAAAGGGSMVYPGAGIALSTGSAWGTSITDNSTNWNTAYSKRITSALLSASTLTLTLADATTVTASVSTFNQNTTGSAATLTTARTINGVSFNGSANITVTADASTLTGTTLNSTVTASSLTSLGTITSLSAGAVNASGDIYSITKLKTAGNVEFTTDNTGLYNSASGYTFNAVAAGTNAWYTPQSIFSDGNSRAKQYSSTVQNLTDGATITFNANLGSNAVVTLGGNRTLAFSNVVAGTYYTLRVIQDATGSRTLTLPASCKVIGGGSGAITLSTASASVDLITFYYDGTNYYTTYGTNYN